MKDIAPILKSLGLLESEVKVYLAALELGPSTVIEIAKSTRLSRPATYTAIGTLSERGLMSTVTRGKRKLFAAEHPERLLHYAQRKEQELSERVADLGRLLPELTLRVGGEKPVVKSFDGKEGIHALVEDIRSVRPKEILEMTNVDAMFAVIASEDLAPLRRELQSIGSRVRGLYRGERIAPPSVPGSEKRILPDAFGDFQGHLAIYSHHVAFAAFTGKMHAVIIENGEVVNTLRVLFELAWAKAQEFPKP
ncbi:MAG: helix-turn-helix domain-containing protein [bacterium]|nr:helix-turn-helix domain-containing protein [bacterium]